MQGVVAGSDDFECVYEAKMLGYETCVLSRVRKERELKGRQRKHMNGYGTSGQSSGSETMPTKMVEQGVDEILHLKMANCIIDNDIPSTMVVATGDAAEAEYSDGFLKMVERALKKGWRVELVAFGRSIGSAYRKMESSQRWGGAFRIIELDPFAEALLVGN